MSEIWKEILGFEGLYEVSNMGRIKSFDKKVNCKSGGTRTVVGKIFNRNLRNKRLYYVAQLKKDGKTYAFNIHQIVASHFLSPQLPGQMINHINGNKHDNRAENLEWCTAKDNVNHAFKIGLMKKRIGSENHRSILTEQQVIYIRFNSDGISADELSLKYGVKDTTIKDIRRGVNWPHVKQKGSSPVLPSAPTEQGENSNRPY